MSDTPRRWFQIHLSTAVVMMFVAGAVMCVNLIPYSYYYGYKLKYERVYGFPLVAYCSHAIEEGESEETLTLQPPGVRWLGLVGNLLMGVCALKATIAASESIIRRREARKP